MNIDDSEILVTRTEITGMTMPGVLVGTENGSTKTHIFPLFNGAGQDIGVVYTNDIALGMIQIIYWKV